jgi:hypothetical protein
LGQASYDGSSAHFTDNSGSVGGSRGKYSLGLVKRTPVFLTVFDLSCYLYPLFWEAGSRLDRWGTIVEGR